MTGRSQLLWFTAIHPLVDACSFCVLIAGGMTVGRTLAYNALAFALQMPLGVALDLSRPGLARRGFYLGTGMVAVAAAATWIGLGGWGVLCVACIGNALFHLTAGKRLLESHEGRSGPMGLFISTGALGLLAGHIGMEKAAATCIPLFAAALVACVALSRVVSDAAQDEGGLRYAAQDEGERRCAAQDEWERRCAAQDEGGWRCVAQIAGFVVLLGLFALIAWRSWAALEATRLTMEAGLWFILCGALATWAGKAAGGYLAERLGRWPVTVASVCGSLALAFVCSPESFAVWMALLFTAQLATGPVLSLVYDRTRRLGGGTAFGVNCLGLFAGSM